MDLFTHAYLSCFISWKYIYMPILCRFCTFSNIMVCDQSYRDVFEGSNLFYPSLSTLPSFHMHASFFVKHVNIVVNNNICKVFQKTFVFIKSHITWVIRYIMVYTLETTHGLLTKEISGGLTHTRWANPSVKVVFSPLCVNNIWG